MPNKNAHLEQYTNRFHIWLKLIQEKCATLMKSNLIQLVVCSGAYVGHAGWHADLVNASWE